MFEAGARLASKGRGRCVLLLAASGGVLVAVVVTMFPVATCCPILHVHDGTGVCGFPTSCCVQGLGWFCLWPSTWWRFEVVVLVFPIFGVPAALAGEGMVILTGPCSQAHPLLPSARGSSSRELGVGRHAETCFGVVPDSVGFCGSHVCVTTLVGSHGIALFYSAAL
ncbi:hypothetical protein Taro_010813 [Colocasia esculenta]|uniref:Uncharacterized protein n=1 Tax=Colocasia esculenta TaxID=4460 RepID=A0A843UE69_COLES|nr:hypothetical protein [Colocasia esculenta]